MDYNIITGKIIGAAINVHKELVPGMLENTYRHCLAYELETLGLKVRCEVPVPIVYKEVKLDCGYRIDILVEDAVVVELKTVDAFNSVFEAQVLTYMRFANKHLGLLINFRTSVLKNGIKRYIL